MSHPLTQLLIVGFSIACLLGVPSSRAEQVALTDVQAKLAIIHNFVSQYVRWPGRYSLDRNRQFYLCSFGTDDIVKSLPLLERASTEELKVIVAPNPDKREISICHVLYIADSQKSSVRQHLNKVKDMPVLTISGIKNFTEQGGMVGLETEIKHQGNFEKQFVRYSLNSRALSHAELFIEPDALELAKRVIRE